MGLLSCWFLTSQTGCKVIFDAFELDELGLDVIPITKDVLLSPTGQRLMAGAADDLSTGDTSPMLYSMDFDGNIEPCNLPLKAAFVLAEACAAAEDGSVIGFLVDDQFRVRGIRWALKDQFGEELAHKLAENSPTDISFNGQFIVGAGFGEIMNTIPNGPEGGSFVVQATLWTAPDFAPQDLDFLPGGDSFNDALTVTSVALPSDQEGGDVGVQVPLIGGFAFDSSFNDQPILWLGTSIREVLDKGTFNGGTVTALSKDGRFAAGSLFDASFSSHAAVWHDDDGDFLNYELLVIDTGGQLADVRASEVVVVPNVSGGGEGPSGSPLFLVLGDGIDAKDQQRAFSFDTLNGFQLLDEAFAGSLGADLKGMTISRVGGATVDDNGTVHITGQGIKSDGTEDAWAVQIFTQDIGGKDVPGDCDGDNDVDLLDWAEFQLCYTGPDGPVEPGCECGDFDGDDDIDLVDFGNFQLAFTGPL
jgi:hypothetical protein